MITKHHDLFALQDDGFTCLIRVNKYGLPELIHFGAPVSAEDAAALTLAPGTGWGSSVLLEDSDPSSCADAMALAWSGSGRGDFRESPLELEAHQLQNRIRRAIDPHRPPCHRGPAGAAAGSDRSFLRHEALDEAREESRNHRRRRQRRG